MKTKLNNKKISLVASLIFVFELVIFIIANHRHFDFSAISLWLILNSCIIVIVILSSLNKLSNNLLITLASANLLPNLIVLLGIGFSGIKFLIIFWIGAIILNIYLIITGVKSRGK